MKAGGDAVGVIRSGMGHQETAAARLCVMQVCAAALGDGDMLVLAVLGCICGWIYWAAGTCCRHVPSITLALFSVCPWLPQCLQHACISWHKIYMGESSSSLRDAAAVPATAAECLHRCGMLEVESGCVAQVCAGALILLTSQVLS